MLNKEGIHSIMPGEISIIKINALGAQIFCVYV
jgi:hypothetical protein